MTFSDEYRQAVGAVPPSTVSGTLARITEKAGQYGRDPLARLREIRELADRALAIFDKE